MLDLGYRHASYAREINRGLLMKNESLLYGVIGLLAGILVTTLLARSAINDNNSGMQRVMGVRLPVADRQTDRDADSTMSMGAMMSGLDNKTGDSYDRTFISEMIVHHQGAIDMAKAAKTNAKHDELKKLADDIVAAQTAEIKQMKQWQLDWGYDTSGDGMGSMHMGN
jgi:uncharacterized protein (DUF305 family)